MQRRPALGFIEVDHDAEHIYLGGLEERDQYCLILRLAESPGLVLYTLVNAETRLWLEERCRETDPGDPQLQIVYAIDGGGGTATPGGTG